jgi:D-alanyl-D-alanine carboxypeptidase/D-alanyl-D-alanine-endopeptidase (penicillin-binding protein 4)
MHQSRCSRWKKAESDTGYNVYVLVVAAALAPMISDPLGSTMLRGAVISALVVDSNGKVVYQRNPDTRVMPASNQKLLTCAQALVRLGREAHKDTRFWKEADKVIVDASGDATLTTDALNTLRSRLGLTGSEKVELRQAYRSDRPDTWQIGDAPNRYAPAIHAFCVDKSGVELWSNGGNLEFRPPTSLIRIEEHSGSGSFSTQYDPFRSVVTFTGQPSGTKIIDTLSVPEPDKVAATKIGNQLTYVASVPNREPDATIYGPNIGEVAKKCLKPSDNHLAEHLLLQGSGSTTHEKARAELSDWLVGQVGFEKWAFNVADGSGLSRKNNITARMVCRLLMWMDKRPISAFWKSALAESGAEGTLRDRLKGISFFGKTGTLDMVSSLSGYVKCKDGSTRVLSVTLNHYGCTSTEARTILDRFVEYVR